MGVSPLLEIFPLVKSAWLITICLWWLIMDALGIILVTRGPRDTGHLTTFFWAPLQLL